MSDAELLLALRELDIEPSEFDIPRSACALEALKSKVSKRFRKAARRLHPDVTNNDPAKAERFRIVCEFAQEVDGLTVQPRTITRLSIRWSA